MNYWITFFYYSSTFSVLTQQKNTFGIVSPKKRISLWSDGVSSCLHWGWGDVRSHRRRVEMGNGIASARRVFSQLSEILKRSCLITLKNVLQPLLKITTKLQKRDVDIHAAYGSSADWHNDSARRYWETVRRMVWGVSNSVPEVRDRGRNSPCSVCCRQVSRTEHHIQEKTLKNIIVESLPFFSSMIWTLKSMKLLLVSSCFFLWEGDQDQNSNGKRSFW